MRGGCEGERERVGRTEQEALFKDAPPFPLEVCPSGGPGDWGGEEGGGRARVGRDGNVVGGDGVGGGVDAGGRECRRGREEGRGHLGGGGGRRVSGRQVCQAHTAPEAEGSLILVSNQNLRRR